MAAYKIACLDVLHPAVQSETRAVAEPDFAIEFAVTSQPAELHRLAAQADFLLIGPTLVDAALVEHCHKVRLVQKYGVGLDRIDVEALRRRGIPFAIAAGGNAAPVAELVLALMLAVNRRIVYADRVVRAGGWPRPEMRATCMQLDGKTIGLLGFGAIAQATARRLRGFEVDLVYHSRRRAPTETERALNARYVSFDALIEGSDVLSIHLPLTAETDRLIDAQVLARMKPSAILINSARGAIVDEAALADALRSGRLRGAGLDVFVSEPPRHDDPLLALDNVVVMPHAGGGVFDNVGPVMGHSINNMRKVLAGEPLPAADVIVPVAS